MYYRAGSFLGSWEAVCTILPGGCLKYCPGRLSALLSQHRIACIFRLHFGCISVAFRIKSDTSVSRRDRLSLLSYLDFGSA